MADPYQITIIRKNNKTLTSMSDAPMKDIYAMLYSAIVSVSVQANQSVKATLMALADLDDFVNASREDAAEHPSF